MLWGRRRDGTINRRKQATDGVPYAPAERLEQVPRCLDQNSAIIAVVEMSQSSWLVGGIFPGIERQPRKKLEPSPERLLALLHRWRDESGAF